MYNNKNNKFLRKSFVVKNNPPIERSYGETAPVKIPVYPIVNMITIGDINMSMPNMYYINNNKLYQYNNIGTNSVLVNGNYQFTINNILHTYSINNGEMKHLNTYFDFNNNKLIVKSNEVKENGMIILTDDMKIYIYVNNIWTKH